jgi:nicotinate-nucleotide adenylyltransferase
MEIALFGTSADPPSVGHQQILAWLAQHYDKCVVWVSDNPFKQHQATLTQRLAMMALTIQDLGSAYPNLELHPDIANSRTIYTVELARQRWQNAHFTLVVGADLLPQLPKWYRSADLLSQVKLLVMPRHGIEITPALIAPLLAMGTIITIAPTAIADVSSTAYRHHHDRTVIIPAVSRYIESAQLYRCPTLSDRLNSPAVTDLG